MWLFFPPPPPPSRPPTDVAVQGYFDDYRLVWSARSATPAPSVVRQHRALDIDGSVVGLQRRGGVAEESHPRETKSEAHQR